MEKNSATELTSGEVKLVETLKQQLKQQEKLASLGMLSAGIAHEIQNPLNFVINFSKLSEKLMKDLMEIIDDNKDKLSEDDCMDVEDIVADLKDNMEKIIEHGERAISIIQGILLVSRGKENEFVPSDVNHIVKEYVWLSYHAMRAKDKSFNISIHEEYQDNIPRVMIIPQDFSRAILNLMNNACYTVYRRSQKSGEDYKPTITVKTAIADGKLTVTLADNGEGMDDEVKEHLFENFFTTKPIGEGTGLGMSITRDIIENKHGGKLNFESKQGEGTCFTLTIPIKK